MNTVADCLQRHYRVVVFAVYLAVVIVTMAFHEPWFDEAQSWLIARDCPYRDLLLVRPHYEGHPPLWWLLLSIPAKLGVPYEWGLKGVELVCSALMCGLLVFRAPLPRLAVALLPFTYFLCYQYGVTSRPYALMCCALFVIAACWKSRDEHPWRLTAAFVLLCCTSSYGIALACAFALVWMVRAIRGATGRPAVRDGLFGNPARFAAWMVLLAVGLVLTACVLPRSDTFGAVQDPGGNPPIAQFALFWTVLPAESMFTAFAGDVSLHGLHMGVLAIALCVALSLAIWSVLARVALRRKNLDLLLVTYVLLSLCATKYFSMHHIGIIFALFVVQLWINVQDKALGIADIPAAVRHIRVRCAPPVPRTPSASRTSPVSQSSWRCCQVWCGPPPRSHATFATTIQPVARWPRSCATTTSNTTVGCRSGGIFPTRPGPTARTRIAWKTRTATAGRRSRQIRTSRAICWTARMRAARSCRTRCRRGRR